MYTVAGEGHSVISNGLNDGIVIWNMLRYIAQYSCAQNSMGKRGIGYMHGIPRFDLLSC